MIAERPASALDGLTGLLTRRAFVAQAQAALTGPARPLTLILADIDACKRFNGCHGHLVGDALIVQVAELCRRATPAGGIVARVAGETFAILAPGAELAGAARIAEQLRLSVREAPLAFEGQSFTATIRVGLAEAPASGGDIEALLAAADDALFVARRAGGDCVRAG